MKDLSAAKKPAESPIHKKRIAGLDLPDCSGSIYGGEGGIRTPGTLASTSDFESGAFNRALPPLRCCNPSF